MRVIIKDRLQKSLRYLSERDTFTPRIERAKRFGANGLLSQTMEDLKKRGYKFVEAIEYHG